MRFSIPRLKTSPLAYKLLFYILLSSSIVTFFITAIQLYFEYETDVGQLSRRFDQVQMSYVDSIANSVWNFDATQYEIQLQGILHLEDIVYVAIVTPEGKRIASRGVEHSRQIIRRTFSLETLNFGKPVQTGTLVVVASLQRIYRDLFARALIILGTQGIKTLVVSAIIVWLFYRLVTRHLWNIAGYAKRMSLDDDGLLGLDKPYGKREDEIDWVVNALNDMKKALVKSYEHINELNHQLETRVLERTRELETANKALAEQQSQLITQKESLEILATQDSLTKVYNRHKLDQLLKQQWYHALREGERKRIGLAGQPNDNHWPNSILARKRSSRAALKRLRLTLMREGSWRSRFKANWRRVLKLAGA